MNSVGTINFFFQYCWSVNDGLLVVWNKNESEIFIFPTNDCVHFPKVIFLVRKIVLIEASL